MTAFPSITTVTFDFASASDPLASPWLANTPSGGTVSLLQSTGGICNKDQPSTTGFGSQVLGTTLGPDMEAWCRVGVSGNAATITSTTGQEIIALFLRLQQDGAATVDGYVAYVNLTSAGTGTWNVDRIDNNSQTTLGGAGATHAIVAGDYVGAKVEGSVITGYWCAAASDPTVTGNWTQVVSATDATYTGTGRVALETQGIANQFDDMRVGTVVAAPTTIVSPLKTFGPSYASHRGASI